MIDFLKGTVGKDYFSDRLYGCQECIAEYLASKEPCTLILFASFPKYIILGIASLLVQASNRKGLVRRLA